MPKPDYLRMDIADLVRALRRKGDSLPSGPRGETHSMEARLRVVPDGDRLRFYSLLCEAPLLSIQAQLAGQLSKFSETADRGRLQMVVSVPVKLEDGSLHHVRVTHHSPPGIEPAERLEKTRATHARVPPDSTMVEFLFTHGELEFRYVFEFSDRILVDQFEPVVDRRPIFRAIPPVAQMAAFLRAMTQQRRSAIATLEDLARSGSIATQRAVALMASEFPKNHDFQTERIQSLVQLFRRHGRSIHPTVVAAHALFADLELGRMTEADILASSGGGPPLEVSPLAVWLTARHFEVEPDEGATAESASADRVEAVLASMKRSSSSRTHLDILCDLARQSNSYRVQAFVEAVRPRLPSGQFRVNDEQVALGLLLSRCGLSVSPLTLTALCLFVDVEVGVLTELDMDRLVEAGDLVDTSMYAMVAVAGAFDLGLRGFSLEESGEPALPWLADLIRLSDGRLIARFRKEGVEGNWWEYLASPEEALSSAERGLTFTGHVLGWFEVIDQLNELDLEVFLQADRPLFACFSADYDRAILWRKLQKDDIAEADPTGAAKGRFTYIRGFTAFHFNRLIMAALVDASPESLLGKLRVVTADLDARGNYHFRYVEEVREAEQLTAAREGSGMAWSGKVAVFPDVSSLPGLMSELGQDPLLGRRETLLEEVKTLERIHLSVRRILTAPHPYLSLHRHPELVQQVQLAARSASVATALAGLMDDATRDGLVDYLSRPDSLDCLIYEPLARAVASTEELEFLTLRVLYRMCVDDSVQLVRRLKQFDEPRLRQMLRNRLHSLVDSENPHTRAVAVRLLATSEEIRDRNDRMINQYELSRALEDPQPAVSEAASDAMALLALDAVIPLPAMVEVRPLTELEAATVTEVPVEETRGLASDEIGTLALQIRKWLLDKKRPPEGNLPPEQAKRQARLRDLARRHIGPDGEPVEASVQKLAVFFTGLNRAVEDLIETRRYFMLISADEVAALRGAVFDSWKVFAFSQGVRLADLVHQVPPSHLMLDYRFFLEEHGRELTDRFDGTSPVLGGAGRPTTLYLLQPEESFGIWRRKQSSFVEAKLEEAPLFLDLLAMLEDGDLPRVLRVTRASGAPLDELENVLPSFVTERIIEPWSAEIFQAARLRFAPLLHKMSLRRDQLGTEEDDWDDYEALLKLLQGRVVPRPEPAPTPAAPAAAAPELPPLPEVPPRPGFKELAGSLAQMFDLPEQYTKQVVNILLEIGSDCVYDL